MSRRAGLDRTTVVLAAAVLADTEGPEALTLARLAAELGVRVPSLYNHIDGQEGLQRALALLGLQELGARLTQAVLGKSRDAAIKGLARAYRAFATARPGLYATTLKAPAAGDTAWDAAAKTLLDILFAVLAAYGLEGDEALHAIRGIRSLLHGFVSLEAAGGFGLPLQRDESFERLLDLYISGLHQQEARPTARLPQLSTS